SQQRSKLNLRAVLGIPSRLRNTRRSVGKFGSSSKNFEQKFNDTCSEQYLLRSVDREHLAASRRQTVDKEKLKKAIADLAALTKEINNEKKKSDEEKNSLKSLQETMKEIADED